jgi:hypothetical protein
MPSEPNISSVILQLADWVSGLDVSPENIRKMQNFGFIFPDETGQLQLTPSGEQVLGENKVLIGYGRYTCKNRT